MSFTLTPVKVDITWKGIRGAKNIKREIRAAIVRALESAVDGVIAEARKIVPESSKRVPAYPAGYRTKRIMRSYIVALEKSLIKATSAQRSKYKLQEKWAAEYAEHVNEYSGPGKTGKGWSKAGSEAGFIEKLHALLISLVKLHLAIELKSVQGTTKYAGVGVS